MIDAITPYSIAASVLLLKDVHQGSILVLEGSSDISLYGKFIDRDECQPVNAYNKQNVIKVIELLDEETIIGVIGIVDADFNRVTGRLPESPKVKS